MHDRDVARANNGVFNHTSGCNVLITGKVPSIVQKACLLMCMTTDGNIDGT